VVAYCLTEKARIRLKHPIGTLILGPPKHTIKVLHEAIKRESPPKVYMIGDYITINALKYDVQADLYVIDNKIMRKPVKATLPINRTIVQTKNPPGIITSEAWDLMQQIIKDERILVIVEGEEDLLALPIIKFAPLHAFVVYGQPHVGLVLVRVTEAKKKQIDNILNMMERISNKKA
jgi:uncharacterized protein (UPF0218 family)